MELRAKTNAGMMACKKALAESGGDMEKAAEYLRKRGLITMDGRQDRVSKEGSVNSLISNDGNTGVLVEINCETDFVAKNEGFRSFVNDITAIVLNSSAADVTALLAEPHPSGKGTIDEAIKSKGAETGENTVLRRFTRFTSGPGSAVGTYLHPGGRVGVVIEVAATKPETLQADAFKALLKDLTMHIAAADPRYLVRGDVPADVVAKEKAIYAESDRLKGKPAAAMEGILNGMLNKFHSLICLMEQGFVKDPDQSIADLVKATGTALGDNLTIKRFARFALGEETKA